MQINVLVTFSRASFFLKTRIIEFFSARLVYNLPAGLQVKFSRVRHFRDPRVCTYANYVSFVDCKNLAVRHILCDDIQRTVANECGLPVYSS